MPGPIIILTCMRSYSSLVSGMLGAHRQLYALPELNLFCADTIGELLRLAHTLRPSAEHGLLRTIAQMDEGKQTEQSIERARAWLRRNAAMSTRALLHGIMERAAPAICIEKSPATVLRPSFLHRLLRDFPEARVIHLTRHPLPTCLSMRRVMQQTHPLRPTPPQPTADVQRLWCRAHDNILRVAQQLPAGNYIRLSGERFLGDHRRWFPQLAEWLDVSAEPEDLDAIAHPEVTPYAFVGPPNARFGNDPNFLRSPAFQPRPIPVASLDGPLPWTDADGTRRPFGADTKALARRLGYR